MQRGLVFFAEVRGRETLQDAPRTGAFWSIHQGLFSFSTLQMRMHTLHVREREREEKEPSSTGNRQEIIVKNSVSYLNR